MIMLCLAGLTLSIVKLFSPLAVKPTITVWRMIL